MPCTCNRSSNLPKKEKEIEKSEINVDIIRFEKELDKKLDTQNEELVLFPNSTEGKIKGDFLFEKRIYILLDVLREHKFVRYIENQLITINFK